MKQLSIAICLCSISLNAMGLQAVSNEHAEKAWTEQSNEFTNMLLEVEFNHSPESGSEQGVAKFDERISDPSRTDEVAARHALEVALNKIKAASASIKDKNVKEDITILQKHFDLQFRIEDFQFSHEVQFFNASAQVFQGLRGLLDDQVAAPRRSAALVRLNKYAGVEVGYKPFTERLKERELQQMAKPGVFYPSKAEVETELGRNSNYVDGIPALFKKYGLTGWEPAYRKLKLQLADYDAWIKASMLPKARADFRLPPTEYALALEGYGVDIAPAQIAEMAHAAFLQYQAEMEPLAAQVAKSNGFAAYDYRSVIGELKKKQIAGEAILPLYENRLHEIEKTIVANNLVTLPSRPAIIRLATAAESAQIPAPHMTAPPLLNNTGQRGEFVLPLNIPSAAGGAEDRYDDFTFDAVAWPLTAHEARPGHELQFDSMVEHGVSIARALYALNSTNAEGWGLYAEYVMQPYEPAEGQLLTLQLRLLRAARAFLDPELQSGVVTVAQAYSVLEKDVMLSHAMAQEEVERYTFRAPGQANSYFYGYTRLLALRGETEAALGNKFDQKKFHDFILAQGLLPLDLVRAAVIEEFISSLR
jgi:uncharacterized protein (DUF885 family)